MKNVRQHEKIMIWKFWLSGDNFILFFLENAPFIKE